MNVAWQQVGDVLAANRLIRFAQLTNEALLAVAHAAVAAAAGAQPDKLMLLSAPVQKRILIERAGADAAIATGRRTPTVAHQLKTSVVPPVAVSAQMRRILRPRGRVVKRLPFAAREIAPHALVRGSMRARSLPAPRSRRRAALAVRGGARRRGAAAAAAALAGRSAAAVSRGCRARRSILALARRARCWRCLARAGAALAGVARRRGGLLVYAYREMRRIERELAAPQIFKDGAQTPEMVTQAPKSPDFRLTTATETFPARASARPTAPKAVRFKTAVTEMYAVDVAARAAAVRAAEAGAGSRTRDRPRSSRRCIRRAACRDWCSTASCCPIASRRGSMPSRSTRS